MVTSSHHKSHHLQQQQQSSYSMTTTTTTSSAVPTVLSTVKSTIKSQSQQQPQVYYYNNNNNSRNNNNSTNNKTKTNKSIDEEIDQYTQQLIISSVTRNDNDNEDTATISYIDDSLGSYINNCLRTTLIQNDTNTNNTTNTNTMIDITTLDVYESLCELLYEHCMIEIHVATNILQQIINILITKQIPTINTNTSTQEVDHDEEQHIVMNCITQDEATNLLPINLWNDVVNVNDDNIIVNVNVNVNDNHDTTNNDHNHHRNDLDDSTRMKSLDETSQQQQQQQPAATTSISEELNTLLEHNNIKDSDNNHNNNNIHDNNHIQEELVHTNDIQIEQQKLELEHQQQHIEQQEQHDEIQQQYDDIDEYIIPNVAAMLLQMNIHDPISNDAAYAAAIMSQGNVHIGQYIILQAKIQLPICRNLLMNDYKCYRSDCTYNHNILHHTCVFWLKSRCSKGYGSNTNNTNDNNTNNIESCRFLHGFSETLLDNIPNHLLQHSTITPYNNIHDYHATTLQSNNNNYTYPYSTNTQYDINNNNNNNNNNNTAPITTASNSSNSVWGTSNKNSFAKIASQGYNNQQSFTTTTNNNNNRKVNANDTTTTMTMTSKDIQNQLNTITTILIPQHLWQAHENRDASAFLINDPMERYYTVISKHHHNPTTTTSSSSSNSTKRDDTTIIIKNNMSIIDLHYQSTKTFTIVLDTILHNQLLLSNLYGIWIITGTGHHININKTHQKGNSTLENSVLIYLLSYYQQYYYRIYKGKDRNGKGGAIFIQSKEQYENYNNHNTHRK